MVRKRGLDNAYERIGNKKRSLSSIPTTPSNTIEVKNTLSEGLLSLYKQEITKLRKESVDVKDSEMPEITNKANEKFKSNNEETMTPASTKRIKKNSRKAMAVKYPKINLDNVGGIDHMVEKLFKMLMHLKDPRPHQELNSPPKRGCLLHGPPGCGKTHLARAIAGEFELPLMEIAATELVHSNSEETDKEIRETFDEAIKLGQCILFIDEIDVICPKRESTNGGMEKHMVSQVIKCLDELNEKDVSCNVILIGATNDLDSIDPALRRGGRFDWELAMGIPNEKSRLQILQILCKDTKLSPDFDLSWVAHHTAGYVGADLKTLKSTALEERLWRLHIELSEISCTSAESDNSILSRTRALYRSMNVSEENLKKLFLEQRDFKVALQKCVPFCKREGFASVPEVTWEDIGALENVKKELRTTIMWPVKYGQFYEENDLSSTKGILLYGPKGCGKTLVAKALANECNINFLSVNGPELLSMYLGESEKAVRKSFERARNSAPCVIFFDEFDALCPSRSRSNNNAAAERVVNQLLTEMDGMQERKQVFVIAATNRIEKIDSAMLRPGRLDKLIYVDLPSSAGRVDILKSLTKNKTRPKISEDLNLETIAFDKRCEEFSGADLAYLIREATSKAVEEVIDTPSRNFILNQSHFDKAFGTVKPSFREEDRKYFEKYRLQQIG